MSGLITFFVILGAAAVIGIVSFVIYRFMHLSVKNEDKPSEEKITEEELNRVLQPIEDEETAKQVSEYKESDE